MIKQAVYIAVKAIIPRPIRRKLLQFFLPSRVVISHQELGQSIKFVLYPSKQEDYGMIFGYELEARHRLPEIVQAGDIVFDVGAHYGLYTLLVSRLVNENGQVHSFDPISENIARLRENIQINELSNVIVNETAVSNTTGTTHINLGNSTKVSSIKSLPGHQQNWRLVDTTTLDDYWDQLGRPKVQLVKIDVEGAESLVVNGMQKLLRESHPHLMLELHLFALDDTEKNEIMDTLFAKNDYVAKLLFVRNFRSQYRKVPNEVFNTWHNINLYLDDAHTAGILMFPNSERLT